MNMTQSTLTPTKQILTIVSGLPRSGTSMMMRMLETGGMPVLVDNIRVADDDNPGGYYEFEPVKQTKQDASWLKQASGKAVKMVYRLLYDLPTEYEYRVLFMRRNLDEVLASQKVMLTRHGKDDGAVQDEQMSKLFRSQLAEFMSWIARQPNFRMLEVDYNQMLADPPTMIAKINDFLGGTLDSEAMAGVVNPTLYRNRKQ
jgi:hypothetical protein